MKNVYKIAMVATFLFCSTAYASEPVTTNYNDIYDIIYNWFETPGHTAGDIIVNN